MFVVYFCLVISESDVLRVYVCVGVCDVGVTCGYQCFGSSYVTVVPSLQKANFKQTIVLTCNNTFSYSMIDVEISTLIRWDIF